MPYRLSANIEATTQVPGGEYTVRTPLGGTGPGRALSTGVVGVPAGTLSGASFGISLGDVTAPELVLLKNGSSELNVRVNGAASPLRLGAGGVLLVSHAPESEEVQIASLSVSTVTASTKAGDVTYIISGRPQPVSPPALWFHNNAGGDGIVPILFGYSRAQTGLAEYSGPPAWSIALPATSGLGHGLCVLDDGHIVVATSENIGDVDNGGESWFLVPPGANGSLTEAECPRLRCDRLFAGTPGATAGARAAVNMGDGNILLGTWGHWKMVTIAAWSMSDAELEALPYWSYTGSADTGIGAWDTARVPGTQVVRFAWHDRFYDIDFSAPPGVIDGTVVPGGDGLTRLAHGDNIGRPPVQGWWGFMVNDLSGGSWKQMPAETGPNPILGYPRLHYWNAATLATLPKSAVSPGANPAPTRVLEAQVFRALNLDIESIISGIELVTDGIVVSTLRYGGVPGRCKAWHFPTAALDAGGSHEPDWSILLPFGTDADVAPWWLRAAPGYRLAAR